MQVKQTIVRLKGKQIQLSSANTEGSPQAANNARLDFAKKHLNKADHFWKSNLYQSDRKKKVWRRLGTAHDPKHTTSSVKHGGAVMA